jgi:integrase
MSNGPALAILFPDSPELLPFLIKVYARENPKMAGGSSATLADYKIQVGTLQKYFDTTCLERGELGRAVRIADIDKPLISGCMAWMREKGLAATTCNKLRRSILAIHTFAIQEKELPGKLLFVKKLPELKRDRRAWRPEQIGTLLEASLAMPPIEGSIWTCRHDYALVLFILNTGTRITATMLTPSALLDLQAGEVKVPAEAQKHKSDQVYDLLPITIDALKAIEPWKSHTIFEAWPYDNRQQRKWRTLTTRLKLMLVKAKFFPSLDAIPKYTELWHKLRRCFVTFVAMKHGLKAAQELCGHSTESVTKGYRDQSQAGTRPSVCEALADMIKPPAAAKVDPQKMLFD